MTAGVYYINAEEGIERSFSVTLLDTEDSPIDLSDSTIKLFIKEHFNDCEPLKIVILSTTEETGEFIIRIPADTFVGKIKSNSQDFIKSYVYEVVIFKDGSGKRWLQGKILVSPKVGNYE